MMSDSVRTLIEQGAALHTRVDNWLTAESEHEKEGAIEILHDAHAFLGELSAAFAAVPPLQTIPSSAHQAGYQTGYRKGYESALAAVPPQPEPPTTKPLVTGEFAEWWVCFHCWAAYHVPTTGYYGKCGCGQETQRWPANPTDTLRLLEWRRKGGCR